MTIGARIRTLLELLTDDGTLLAPGWIGTVIGFEGERLVVTFEDPEHDITHQVTCNRWEVRPA